VTTIRGERCGAGVHLYVLGDSYTAAQQILLLDDAARFISFALADEGIRSYLLHWNIHVVRTISTESGIDSVYGVDEVDSAFGSGFNCLGIARMICTSQYAVLEALIEVSNDADALPVLLVNSDRYGGSGGSISVFSSSSPQIALHEMGHSFAGLADEYIDAQVAAIKLRSWSEGRYPNATRFSDPADVPWTHWIDDLDNYPSLAGEAGVGVFEGAYYNPYGFYRPLSTSRMRSNFADFGPVNSETWVLENYRLSSPVSAASPHASRVSLVTGEFQRFSVELQFNEELQDINWFLDGIDQGLDDSKHFLFASNVSGVHTLTLRVRDDSGRIRLDQMGYSDFNWTWDITVGEHL
jgi:hypothetical protein